MFSPFLPYKKQGPALWNLAYYTHKGTTMKTDYFFTTALAIGTLLYTPSLSAQTPKTIQLVKGKGAVRGKGIAHGKGIFKGSGTASGNGIAVYKDKEGNLHYKKGTGTVMGRGIVIGKGTVKGKGKGLGRGWAAGRGMVKKY